MRLASLKSGRDGRLVLVAEDGTRCTPAEAASTLQAALDDWAQVAPRLAGEARLLEAGKAKIAAEVDVLRKELEKQTPALAAEIASRVLGREVSQ